MSRREDETTLEHKQETFSTHTDQREAYYTCVNELLEFQPAEDGKNIKIRYLVKSRIVSTQDSIAEKDGLLLTVDC